jgi:hypothetical protein
VVSAQDMWQIWCYFYDFINLDLGLSYFQGPLPGPVHLSPALA